MSLSLRMAWGAILAGGLALGRGAGTEVEAASLVAATLEDHGVVPMAGDGSYLTLARDNPVRIDDQGNVAVRPPTPIDVPSIGTVWVTDTAGDHLQVGYTLDPSTGMKQAVSVSDGQGHVYSGLGANLQSHYAMAANASGVILGSGKLVDGFPGARPGNAEDAAFALLENPNVVHVFPIGSTAHPFGINDANRVVGAIVRDGVSHAFLSPQLGDFAATGTDLNLQLDPAGGWVFNVATDINNKGQIVGYATDAAGLVHAVELVPVPVPEPAALAPLASGAIVVLLRRRRR